MPRRNPIAGTGWLNNTMSAPQFRFWGAQRPPAGREPVRAQLSGSSDGQTATLRIYAPIDSWGGDWGVSASEVAQALDEVPDVSQIVLQLNSPGGEVYEGIAILNQLRQHPANVVAQVDSLAASAASFIACGSDEVVMGQNSQLMIHDAWGICVGPAADMASMGDLLDKISANIATVYAGKAGNATDWRAAMLAETWYGADEAVAAGLADRVAGAEQDDDAGASNGFDLSMFRHQGRTDAPAPPIPDPAAAPAAGPSALRARRHRMTARRHSLPL